MLFPSRKTIAVLLSALLAACGGGGDSTVASSGQSFTSAGSGSGSSGSDTPASTHESSPASNGSTASANGSGSSGSTTPTSAFKVDETARFNVPSDLTIDSAGNLYVVDSGNQFIRRIATTGEVSTLPGSYAASSRVAMDPSNNLFIQTFESAPPGSTRDNFPIYKLSPDGNRTLVVNYPVAPGSYAPIDISVDAQGRLYVMLRYRNVFRVDRIDPDNSSRTVYSYVNYGEPVGFASDAQGNLAIGYAGPPGIDSFLTFVPQSAQPAEQSSPGVSTRPLQLRSYGNMVFDPAGDLYIVDAKSTNTSNAGSSSTFYVSEMRVIKVLPDGTVATILNGFPDGSTTPRATSSYDPTLGITAGPDGNLYMSDPINAIYRVSPSGQSTLIAGKLGEAGNSD